MCNDPDKFANNKHLPVNEHIHIDTDRGLRFHYRIQSVSCFLFQFLINHISCSCVFNHRRLQRKRFLSRRCFSYPVFLRFLFCLPFFFAPSLFPPAFHYFVAAFSASVNRWIFHFSLSFRLFNVFFLLLRKFH